MNSLYIGIDNGSTGGIVALGENGEILEAHQPFNEDWWISKTKGSKTLDVKKFASFVEKMKARGRAFFLLEYAATRPKACNHSGFFYMGQQIGALKVLDVPFQTIAATTWQKEFFDKKSPGTSKAKALASAKNLFGIEKKEWTDGTIDSLLLAEYARRRNF